MSFGDLFSWTLMLRTCVKLLVSFCCQFNNNLQCVCVCVCVCACVRVCVGKFGKFSESSVICQTKPTKLLHTINNLLADLLIRQTYFTKCLKRANLPNFPPPELSHYTVQIFTQWTLYSDSFMVKLQTQSRCYHAW